MAYSLPDSLPASEDWQRRRVVAQSLLDNREEVIPMIPAVLGKVPALQIELELPAVAAMVSRASFFVPSYRSWELKYPFLLPTPL